MDDGSSFHLDDSSIQTRIPHVDHYHNATERALTMSVSGYAMAAVVLFFIGVIGFSLNFIVIVIMVKEKSLRTPFNMILLNLVCSDFSVSVLGNPITFTAAVNQRWIFGRTVCVAYGFFMALVGITSITTITVLSFERYLNIARPFHSRRFTVGHSKLVVCGIWIYSFVLTFPPLIGWGDYVNESANISCSVNWEHKSFRTTMYIIYLFVMGLVLPVSIICFSYARIVFILTQKRLPTSRVKKIDVRVVVMIAIMVTVFLLAWTPYATLALIIAFGDPNIVTPAVSVIPALIAKSSICYNPIIYAGLNTQIRTAGYKLFGLKRTTAPRSTDDDLETKVNTEEILTEVVGRLKPVDPRQVLMNVKAKASEEVETAA